MAGLVSGGELSGGPLVPGDPLKLVPDHTGGDTGAHSATVSSNALLRQASTIGEAIASM